MNYEHDAETLLTEALALAARGIPVFPVRLYRKNDGSWGKAPAIPKDDPNGWGDGHISASADAATVEAMFRLVPDAVLIGVPTGHRSGFDGLDMDPKNGGITWWAEHHSQLGDTRVNHTVSGGLHYLFKYNPAMRSSQNRIAKGIDVRGGGGWIVWWPAYGCTWEGETITNWPEWLLPLALPPARRQTAPAPAELAAPSVQAVIDLLAAMPNPDSVDRDKYISVCMSVQGCIRALSGDDADQADEIMDAAAEWASRWDGAGVQSEDVERRKWDRDWSHRVNDIAGWRNLLGHASALGVDVSQWTVAEAASQFPTLDPLEAMMAGFYDTPAAEVSASGFPTGDADAGAPVTQETGERAVRAWLSKMMSTADSLNLDANVANVYIALSEDDGDLFQGMLGFDEMLQRNMWLQPKLRMTDNILTTIQMRLIAAGFLKVSEKTTRQAVNQVCQQNSYHPVRDYLRSVVWDGEARLDNWLSAYLGVEHTRYSSGVGKLFLISTVARIMKPGCKADYMLVLEGPQGSRKSTACRILAGEWFSDNLPDLGHKDSSQHLRGKWIIEVAEMSAMTKTDTNRLKGFITRTEETYRPPYGYEEVTEKRQCVFIGSTNDSQYLRDATGGRRFWPVKVGTIDTDALKRDRDQLFAEAVQAFQAGAHWWPDQTFEVVDIQAEQESRYETDAWESLIAAAVFGVNEMTVTDIASAALNLRKADMDNMKQKRIAAALKRLGWVRHHTMRGNVWRRGPDSIDDPIYAPAAATGVDDIPV